MPFKDKKKRQTYMRNYMVGYRAYERQLIRMAKEQLKKKAKKK